MSRLFIVLSLLVFEGIAMDYREKIERFSSIESQYPSYIDSNHLGLCLRSSRDLPAGTVVATADMIETDKPYIAGHPAEEHKYVGLMRVSKEGVPTWGKVRGKWAFSNHSCDPNCQLDNDHRMITRRSVKKGEELTTAYNAFIPNFPWPESWNFECLCGAQNCRKYINGYRTDILDPLCYKALESEEERQELITAWSSFFKATDWKDLIAGCEARRHCNGVTYHPAQRLNRYNESYMITDMQGVAISDPHYHEEMVFYFCLEGTATVVVGDKEQECKAGDVVRIPSRESHYVLPSTTCVFAVVSVPPYNVQHYVSLKESNADAHFDYEKFCQRREMVTLSKNQ